MPAQTPTVCAECGAALRGATIDSLISALEKITGDLEKHTADMNYAGTEEFNVHTFPATPSGRTPTTPYTTSTGESNASRTTCAASRTSATTTPP